MTYSDPLADHVTHAYPAATYVRPASKPTSPTMARPSFRPAPAPSRPPLKLIDPAPGSVPIPAGLSFPTSSRREALAVGMTDDDIAAVMIRFRAEQAGELRIPRAWATTATLALMAATKAHRAGLTPQTAPEPVEHAVIEPEAAPNAEPEPEAAPTTAMEMPDWGTEWDGDLDDVLAEVPVTAQPEPVPVDEDHAPEMEITAAPEPSAQPIEMRATVDTTMPATTKRNPARKRSEPSTLKTSPGIRADRKVVYLRVVAADETLSKGAVRVAIPLFDRINAEVGHSFISMNRLGKEAAMGWRSVQRAINELEDAGYIAVDRIEGEAHHIAIRSSKFLGAKLSGDPKTASRESGRGKVDGGTPAKNDRGSDRMDTPENGADIDPTPAKTDRGTPDKTDRGPLPSVAPVLSDVRAVIRSSEGGTSKNEDESSSPVRGMTGFDKDWPVFQRAYPTALDDTWKPLFLRIRGEGWSLRQLLDGVFYLEGMMCEGQEFWNVATFLNKQMWITDAGMTPEHHSWEYVPYPNRNTFDDMDMVSSPF